MENIFSPEWFAALGSILLLDIVLSGDNAIMIAMACKHLPEKQRTKAIFIGGIGAVAIRIICTLFAVKLLSIPYLEFTGGVLLLYIAFKLLLSHKKDVNEENSDMSFTAAIKTILIADFIMSIDNILSLAGVANTVNDGKWSLIIVGLMISIPIVLCGAQFFLVLLKRFPIITYLGAGILAYTAAKMMSMDDAVGSYIGAYAIYLEAFFVALVIGCGWYKNRKMSEKVS